MSQKPVVVITGASKGIGLAVTTILLEDLGATVVAISRTRSPELVALLDKHEGSLLIIECDIADDAALTAALARTLETHQHIDALILNAGTLYPLGTVVQDAPTVNEWRAHFDVNFFSLVTALQAAMPALRARGGRVVFTSSGSALGATASWAPYNASKAALNSLCRTVANEEPDVTFVALRPGMVDTSMQAALRENTHSMLPADAERFIQAHATGKLVKPADAGHVIAALALRAPKALSGKFVSWDSDECADFRRK